MDHKEHLVPPDVSKGQAANEGGWSPTTDQMPWSSIPFPDVGLFAFLWKSADGAALSDINPGQCVISHLDELDDF